MSNSEYDQDTVEEKVTWSSRKKMRRNVDRRASSDRRQMSGRKITVPDMRSGLDRRSGDDRRKVRLTITGRAMDV